MTISRLDKVFKKFVLNTFFTKGWGNPDNLIRLFEFRKLVSSRELCYKLVSKHHPIEILNEQTWADCQIIEGKFKSPLCLYLPEIVPNEISDAYFQVVLPRRWKSQKYKPVCIHLAGTGDHYFWRRRTVMAKPLLASDIGAVILENPFYGLRKPKEQIRSSLLNVSDIFVMGGCLMLECLVLLHWCEKMGFGPLGISGISMGGHMASLAATNWPKPLVLVPCLSWSTASSVFTEGVMSEAINWDLLQNQYFSNNKFYDVLSKLCKIVDDPFKCQLTHLPEYTLTTNIEEMFRKYPMRYMTPYEMLSVLNSIGLHCAAYTCAITNEKKKKYVFASISDAAEKLINILSLSLLQSTTEYAKMKRKDKEAVWFMRGIMDECSHLKNFSVPYDTSLVISVCATSDAYVPREGCSDIEDIWPGSSVWYINSGHVGAYLWHRKVFREAIIEGFEKAKRKCSPLNL